MAERLRFDTTVMEMDSVQLRDILKPTVVIFAISTTGQGEMPQKARLFWKTLLSGALKPGSLRKVRFSSFGIGDSSYARFNVAHRMLCGRMLQLGAQLFCERGEGNEQHPEGHSAGLREWIVTLKTQLLACFPLNEGVEPIADDEFLEPKWMLQTAASVDSNTLSNELTHTPELTMERRTDVADLEPKANGGLHQHLADILDGDCPDVPSTAVIPVKASHTAHITFNERVTASGHFQDVRLLDLNLRDTMDYSPGAVAVIYPKNFPDDVQNFIELMGWQHVANQTLNLQRTSSEAQAQSPALSPLHHLDLSKVTLTLLWLLENVLDIMSVPRRSFFASLAYFAGSSTEDERYQKERLLELANPELIDELWDYTTRPKRTILEVMMDFTTVKIPWQYVLSVLPMMRGRQFSIASGGHLRRSADGTTRVQLLVAIADPPSPIIKWRRRYGVCTRYMGILRAGQEINIDMQPGYLDVRPGELEVPVVMIGPGTGLAPMRAMIWQRLLWAQELGRRDEGSRLKGDILIFGCRNEHGDHFFQDEWELLQRDEGLKVLTAFSRDSDKPKQYVQDQIRANGALICHVIRERQGKVYVCGSAGNMPKGVREALVDVLVEEASASAREEAERHLDIMEKQGRYKQETW